MEISKRESNICGTDLGLERRLGMSGGKLQLPPQYGFKAWKGTTLVLGKRKEALVP